MDRTSFLQDAATMKPLSMLCHTRLAMIVGLLVAGTVGLAAKTSDAAIFSTFDPARHERYLLGVPNPGFLLDENQITGLGARSALISPLHVITAAHPFSSLPYTATFRGSDGVMRSYNAASFVDLDTTYFDAMTGTMITAPSDVRLITLDAPIPATDLITPIAVYDFSAASIMDDQFNVLGISDRAGANIVDEVLIATFSGGSRPTVTIQYDFDTATNGGTDPVLLDEASLQGGDSGYQAVIEVNGTPALLGSHFGIDISDGNTPANRGNYNSFTSFLSPYVSEIESLVAADGYSITRISAVPEPGALAVLSGLGLMGWCRRKRASAKMTAIAAWCSIQNEDCD